MLKGLPASGKSTYAKELVKKGWKRVNKDDLRAMIDDSIWSKKNEASIKEIEACIANHYLQDTKENVVVDDTNFAYEDFWRKEAETVGAEFEVKFFDTPLKECIKRDALRGDKSVGEKVIRGMYNQYLKSEIKKPEINDNLPFCYIFDIDGTLAKMNDRSPYDWSKVDTDIPNQPIVDLYQSLHIPTVEMIIVSGRDSSCRAKTEDWLFHKAGIIYDHLYMRPEGDMRKDVEIKREIYENHIKGKYNVIAVFDDRDQVVEFWRSQGLTCLQVDEGNF